MSPWVGKFFWEPDENKFEFKFVERSRLFTQYLQTLMDTFALWQRKSNPNAHRQDRKVKAAIPKQKLKAKMMEKGAEFIDAASENVEKNHVTSSQTKNEIT